MDLNAKDMRAVISESWRETVSRETEGSTEGHVERQVYIGREGLAEKVLAEEC
jgi:hypothetical protein